MPDVTIPASVFAFIKDLRANNNRPWFNDNKSKYQEEHQHVIAFADALIEEMNKHDNIETPSGKKSLFRIYRDTRFSKNKTPYKGHFSGQMKRATKLLRGGYYFHIEPGGSFVAGGFWAPNSPDLKRMREDIAFDDKPLRQITSDPVFVETFGELKGDTVKTAPKGFSREHPAIDLLRHKQFIVTRNFTDKEVKATNFLEEVVTTFCRMRPFFDYMSEVLTTDANGLPLE
ncbi:MAG: DUF2461 domain-containing protein [Saprospiraceae bacterium]|nr:DUF2461 domain-containing protein [Saprospiraceae bacterium]